MRPSRTFTAVFAACAFFATSFHAHAHSTAPTHEANVAGAEPTVHPLLQVTGPLPALDAGVTEIKFNELFKMPVGPRGLEPSEKLLALQGKPVRIVGYMAKQETPIAGLIIMSPLPVDMGDEDDKFADNMPANSIFVHLDNTERRVHYMPGLIQLTGVITVGNQQEADDRVSHVRLQLDQAQSALLSPPRQASK